jgi:hypothetical protein
MMSNSVTQTKDVSPFFGGYVGGVLLPLSLLLTDVFGFSLPVALSVAAQVVMLSAYPLFLRGRSMNPKLKWWKDGVWTFQRCSAISLIYAGGIFIIASLVSLITK